MTRKRAVKLLMSYGCDRNTANRVLDKWPKWVPNKIVVVFGRMAYALAKFVTLSSAATVAWARMTQCAQDLASSIRLEASQDRPSD